VCALLVPARDSNTHRQPSTLFPFAFARRRASSTCNGVIIRPASQPLSEQNTVDIAMPAITNNKSSSQVNIFQLFIQSEIHIFLLQSGPTTGPLLIKGGQVVNDDSIFIADVLIDDGQIK
jgi:hypothetical protein